MNLRYAGACARCEVPLSAGAYAYFDTERHAVECTACRPPVVAPGSSAQRIADQRFASRDRATRERHPHIGGLLMALREQPQHERSWATGADAERRIGEMLDRVASDTGAIVLHDRQVPGSRANFDHIVVASAGVFVVDTKRYADKLVEQRSGTLVVGGRRQPKLVTGVERQAEAIGAIIDGAANVRPVLCFVDARWPAFEHAIAVGGVLVCDPTRLRKRLRRSGAITPEGVADITRTLHQRLRAA